MFVTNQRALFLEYGKEPEEYVKLALDIKLRGVDIERCEGIIDSIDSQKIFINAMIPEIQKRLRKLENMEKWTGVSYSAEIDENGSILYFLNVEIVSLEEIAEMYQK